MSQRLAFVCLVVLGSLGPASAGMSDVLGPSALGHYTHEPERVLGGVSAPVGHGSLSGREFRPFVAFDLTGYAPGSILGLELSFAIEHTVWPEHDFDLNVYAVATSLGDLIGSDMPEWAHFDDLGSGPLLAATTLNLGLGQGRQSRSLALGSEALDAILAQGGFLVLGMTGQGFSYDFDPWTWDLIRREENLQASVGDLKLTVHHAPEPASIVSWTVGAGLLGLGAWRRRRLGRRSAG